jgi:hypothetical protein
VRGLHAASVITIDRISVDTFRIRACTTLGKLSAAP